MIEYHKQSGREIKFLSMSGGAVVKKHFLLIAALLATGLAVGCTSASANKNVEASITMPCEIALAQQMGDSPLDQQIARLQRNVRAGKSTGIQLEQLGWSFVEKARLSYDAGFYRLAEQCAFCLEAQGKARSSENTSAEAMRDLSATQATHAALLLRGHALHSLHRFSEAETVARQLTAERGLAFDYGLLGDVLMEQGRLDEAVVACQKMMDLKPGPQAYSRAAHLRWLRGDLPGAIALMQLAATAVGPREAQTAAWMWTRLALLEWQRGNLPKAERACQVAAEFQADYAPMLLVRGRLFLAQGRITEALPFLEKAARLNPLPEYQWWLADTLRVLNRSEEAQHIEAALNSQGAVNDPRTFALYLATRGEQSLRALELAGQEMKIRRDVFTLDTLAWAQLAAGNADKAWETMQRALQENTQDARLFFHAAVIAARNSRNDETKKYLAKATAIQQMLTPLEKTQLTQLRAF
jgi:tetratricopeptide (TPR) repeat protein